MKILMAMNAERDPDSGSAGWMEYLAESIRRQGHQVDLVFRDDIKAPLNGHNPNLSWVLDTPIFLVRRIVKIYKARGPYDIIEIWDSSAYLLALLRRFLPCRRAKFIYNRSVGIADRVWREHKQFRDIFPPSWKFSLWHPYVQLPQERVGFRHCNKVFVASKVDYEFLTQRLGIQPSKIAITPPGVPEEAFATGDEEREGDLLFVGTWIPRKGVKYLVEAFELITQELSEARLTIIGIGHGNEEKAYQAFPPSLRDQVTVIEKVPTAELYKHYKSHKVLIFPSLSEGFVRTVLESMAAELAVVSTDVGGAVDLIRDGWNGYLVPKRSSQPVAERAIYLLQNESPRQEIASRGIHTARNYTWSKIAEKVSHLYEELLNR